MKNKTVFAVCWFEWRRSLNDYEPNYAEFKTLDEAKEFYNKMVVSDDVPQIELIQKSNGEVERLMFKD